MTPSRSIGGSLALALLAGCARFDPQPINPAQSAARLESRSLSAPELRRFLETNLPGTIQVWPPPTWDFDLLYLAALFYQPALDLARAQWQVAVAGNRTAAGLLNPVITAVPGYDLSATGGAVPWIPAVTFDIPVETAGKRRYRMAQAQLLSESARLNLATVAWQVRSHLRTSLIELTAAQEREALLARQNSTQEKIVQALAQQLQAGAVSNSELMLMRVSLNQIQLDLYDAQQQKADARVRVADAIGISTAALSGVRLDYALSAQPAPKDLLSSEARQRALTGRADVLGALADYEAAQAALQLQIAKQYPDIHLGPGYQYDQGDHKITLSLIAELPVLNQNQGPIAEARTRREEAAARFYSVQAKVITEIDRALTAYRVAQENVATLAALAEAHQHRKQIVDAQARVGAADRLDVLNAQIEVGAGELVELAGRVKLQQATGAVEDALQRPIRSLHLSALEWAPRGANPQESKP